MRVTSRSLVNNVVRQLQQNAQAVDKLQTQISSGKRLSRISQDPTAAWRALRFRGEHAGAEQHLRNMDDARNWLVSEDQVFTGTRDALAKLREYAVQGADDSYSANDRLAISREVTQLKEHILSLFNGTQFVGQSLFSGRKTDVQPFTVDASVRKTSASGVGTPSLRPSDDQSASPHATSSTT